MTNDPLIKTSSTLKTHASLVKYWQAPIKPRMVMHIGHWTQFIIAKAVSVADTGDWRKPALTLTLEKPLVYLPNDKAGSRARFALQDNRVILTKADADEKFFILAPTCQ